MNRFALRVVFFVIFATSLGLRQHATLVRDKELAGFNMTASIASVVSDSGLTILPNPSEPPKLLSRNVYFQRPHCQGRSIAMPFSLHVDAMMVLNRVATPDYTKTFVFLDATWPTQNRFVLHGRWLRNEILNIAGASPYLPLHTAIVIADPPGCGAQQKIDWQMAWDRARFQSQVANGKIASTPLPQSED
jgi:hypothetical protein